MNVMIRAKFRCMSVTKTWDHETKVELLPVNRSSSKDPENQLFWDATPGGKAELHFSFDTHEYLPGAYYYIDMEPVEEPVEGGCWRLSTVTHHSDGGGDVKLYKSWDKEAGLASGSLEIWVKYPKTLAMFGKPGVRWEVTFTFAEPTDNDPCMPC